MQFDYLVQLGKIVNTPQNAEELVVREIKVRAKTLSGAVHKALKRKARTEHVVDCAPILRTDNQKKTYALRVAVRNALKPKESKEEAI